MDLETSGSAGEQAASLSRIVQLFCTCNLDSIFHELCGHIKLFDWARWPNLKSKANNLG